MKSIYSLQKGAQLEVKKILTWMYGNATIYLDRKYDLYKKALKEMASAT